MTLDPDLPLTDDEQAVAAVVDGDATAEQRRRVARDPDLVAQVRAVEAAIAAVEAPMLAPGEDVFAALRARAIAEGTAAPADAPGEVEPVAAPVADEAGWSTQTPAPADDLAVRRARRARRLPPLPAVAAVVLVLLLGGIALLVTDSGGSDDQSADTATATAGDSGGDSSGGASESAEDAASADGPAAAFREDLLARAATSYVDEATLLDALRTVDTDTLDLSASPVGADGEATPSTTTVPSPGDDDQPTTAPGSTSGSVVDGRALADDEDVLRCDSVLRAAEPDVGPVTSATFVAVDGIPVLVLSNPVGATDDGPATIRLTVLNAVDCSPRGAVQR